MLRNSRNLRVRRRLVADDARQTNLARVALNSTEQHGVDHAVEVSRGLGVGEGLVGRDLLQTVQVGDLAGALGGGRVAEKPEDGVLDVERVVKLEIEVGGAQDGLVRVLLGHLALVEEPVGHLAGGRNGGDGQG